MIRLARVSAAALVLAGAAVSNAAADGRWLDAKTIANWNKPGMAIPRGPKSGFTDMIAECEKRGAEETKKTQATPEMRQVTAAGWRVASLDKRMGDTLVVLAMNGLDGMCRPMTYQYFVFVNGRFAGTLAPRAMDSRTDGGGYIEEKPNARRFIVDFARYRKNDPLCCPARTSTVSYEIRAAANGAPLVVPVKVATKTNAPLR